MREGDAMHEGRVHERSRAPGGALYWLLLLMGMATFVPCILLPEWREFQALDLARQVEQHKLNVIKKRVDHERRVLEAMRGDPAVISRFAQRDLQYRRVGERVVQIPVPRTEEPTSEPFVPEPAELPLGIARVLSHLPAYNYDRIFVAEDTRPIVAGMSIALIGLAVALFAGRRAVH